MENRTSEFLQPVDEEWLFILRGRDLGEIAT